MKDFKDFNKELALLLETYNVAIVAHVHKYGKDKSTGMVAFQTFEDGEVKEFNTRRCHVTSHDLDSSLQNSPLGSKIEGLS